MNTLMNKNVLVTGGAGFIGSHLVDRLIDEQPKNIIVVCNFFLGKVSNLVDAMKKFPHIKVINADSSDYDLMNDIFKEGFTKIF